MDATQAVLNVGEGRGFVVATFPIDLIAASPHDYDGSLDKIVITAAHCLPYLPPCGAGGEGHTYRKILGPLRGETTVWAECLFADPVMDIAVLGPPDAQELRAEAEAYEKLLASAEHLPIAEAPLTGRLQLLSLEGQWFDWAIEFPGADSLYLRREARDIVDEMFGSPILSMDGAAVGVLSGGLDSEDLIQTTTLD